VQAKNDAESLKTCFEPAKKKGLLCLSITPINDSLENIELC
jgi:hypothetical protein